jgi:hypothetical protein
MLLKLKYNSHDKRELDRAKFIVSVYEKYKDSSDNFEYNLATYLIHISDFVDNETFEQILALKGLNRNFENDYQYIEVDIIRGVK